MAKLWRGPNAMLKAAEADPLFQAIHRRNAKLGVFCNIDTRDNRADFYTLTPGKRVVFSNPLGTIEGPDPTLNSLWGSHRFTEVDDELMSYHQEYIARLCEGIADELETVVTKLTVAFSV